MRSWTFRSLAAAALLAAVGACAVRQGVAPSAGAPGDAGFQRAARLPDLSGLAWIEGDLFLTVHDAKFPAEADRPRVSLLRLPTGLDGILWKPLPVAFPGGGSNDLESVARIPGGDHGPVRVLMAESSEEQATKPRIYLAEIEAQTIEIVDQAFWPVPTTNVESTAVVAVDGTLLFLYAERAEGRDSTEIRFAPIELEPLSFGPFESAGAFTSPDLTGPIARPVTALVVDAGGIVYAASAEDPSDDNGPFRSAVYRIGRVTRENGRPGLVLEETPTLIGLLDGLKVESLAARELPDGRTELWVGTDDENYGGTMRPLTHRSVDPRRDTPGDGSAPQ